MICVPSAVPLPLASRALPLFRLMILKVPLPGVRLLPPPPPPGGGRAAPPVIAVTAAWSTTAPVLQLRKVPGVSQVNGRIPLELASYTDLSQNVREATCRSYSVL